MPFEVSQVDYREEYLKNITESVRVIPPKKLHEITKQLANHPTIYLFAKGISKYAADYVYYVYTMAGFTVKYPGIVIFGEWPLNKLNRMI